MDFVPDLFRTSLCTYRQEGVIMNYAIDGKHQITFNCEHYVQKPFMSQYLRNFRNLICF